MEIKQQVKKEEDLLHPEGLYNPALRFAFTNILNEDFISYWGGQPIRVKPNQTVELQHHLAVKMVKEIVDMIMLNDAHIDEVEFYKNNPNAQTNSYRSPRGLSLGVPAARKYWEDKVCHVLQADEESPEIATMRAQLRDELIANANKEKSVEPPPTAPSLNEFSELGKETPKAEKKPMKLKEVKNETSHAK